MGKIHQWIWAAMFLMTAATMAQSLEPPPHHPHARPGTSPSTAPTTQPADQREGVTVTTHQITIHGKVLKYQSTAGTLAIKDETGKVKASMFFVAYEPVAEKPDPATRPITFVFNGGPGAAAVWLHLGAVGPKRINLDDTGRPGPPPFHLIDNEQTWLDMTDLVFIDPVGTGYSRPAQGEKGEEFYGVQQDVASVAEFIRLYTTRYKRWASAKFLAGESYGTTRAAGLSEYLLDHEGIALNGIIFISTVLDFSTIHIDDNNPMAFPLQLPTYAATAWFHKKLANPPAQLDGLLGEVRQFALNDYAAALAKGDKLSLEDRRKITDQLVKYTGLPRSLIERANLRIDPWLFEQNLLADSGKVIGRFDTRVTGYSLDRLANYPDYDPSLTQYYSVYSSMFNDYVRRDLGYENDMKYEVLSDHIGHWNFGQEGGGYLNVAGKLRSAMAKNPYMKLMFASGYFDLATPFLATDYTIDHLDLAPELRRNITQTYYTGGHMIYHDPPSLVKLREDVGKFMAEAMAK